MDKALLRGEQLKTVARRYDVSDDALGLSFARTLHVSQHKRIAPITVRLIPRLLSGELKKKAGQTATNTTPRVTAIACANCGKSEAAKWVATPPRRSTRNCS